MTILPIEAAEQRVRTFRELYIRHRASGGSMEFIVTSVCIREIAVLPQFVSVCNNLAIETKRYKRLYMTLHARSLMRFASGGRRRNKLGQGRYNLRPPYINR
jgi:hypothetical protein